MTKQIHIRLSDHVYDALSEYAATSGQSVQDSVSSAVMQMLNKQQSTETEGKFTFIDLFAGIGGMRIAFQNAGGRCVYSSEWNKYSQQTYFANFGEQPDGDITKVGVASIPDHDILVAGFPCQPFSIAGVSKKQSLGRATGFEDKTQGTLFFDVCRILKAKRPKAFMLENVKNLCSHDRGRTFRVILESLEELNYAVFYQILDGQNFVPQHRERILIVGFDREQYGTDIDFEFDIRSVQPKPVMKDILEPVVDDRYTLSDKLWSYLQKYAAKHKAAGNGFGYGLAPLDGVSRTLSARYYKDGAEILIPQTGKNPRRLTPRECARLQGFPDSFIIPVSDTQAYRQFGNSVVVPLMANVAELIVRKIDEMYALQMESCTMADILTPEQRSKNMSAIRNKDTKPEIYIRKKLFSMGYHYRKNYSRILGCPDIYLAKYKAAIFVHGCFWHRHEGCRYAYTPKSRTEFWNKKFQDNVQRGKIIKERLHSEGIRCLIIWECTIKAMKKSVEYEEKIFEAVSDFIKSDIMYMEL